MTPILAAVVVATFAVAPAVRAQSLGEYGSLTKPSVASTGISKSISLRVEKLSTKTAGATNDAIKGVDLQEKTAQARSQPVAKPTPPAVFILSNGDRLESSRYLLTVDLLLVQQGQTERTIPLSAIDVDATIAASRKRGINLTVPKSRSEMTLSF
jgi:hypothetical protein